MRRSRFLTFLFTIAGLLSLTLILLLIVEKPPWQDFVYLALLLAATGTASAAIGYFSQRLGWWTRVPSLRIALSLGYVLAAGLILLNVWITARLMFVEQHDLNLAILLMVFAAGIAAAFGYFLSGSISERLTELAEGAARLSEGDLSTRIPVAGEDEVARLTRAFNTMAARLEAAAARAQADDDARRTLIAGASHDLRTPLASLRAMLDALADGVVGDPETTTRYLEQSRAEIARMSHLIDDLFELASLDAGLPLAGEPGSLSDLISDSLAAFAARAAARDITLEGSVAPGIDPVWMAADKIDRVLANLLDNALRHTPPGGFVRVRAALEDGMVRVTVGDSGPGIPPADLPQLFDAFFRGDRSRARGSDPADSGAGLGLAIAHRLIAAHGGTITAANNPTAGATITFTLPHRQRPPAA
jgi:signal transduction histidine kinase